MSTDAKEATEPAVLYHHCSLPTLMNIASNRSLWLTNFGWMDDVSEGRHLAKIAESLKAANQASPALLNAILEKADARSHVYCTCFSEVPDLLSQWLIYGDDGRGVAIGFRATALDRSWKSIRHISASEIKRDLELRKVVYDESKQKESAERILRDFGPLDHGDDTAQSLATFFGGYSAWYEGMVMKNPHFQAEQEWRLIFYDDPDDAIRFRSRGSSHVVPYIEYVLQPQRDPICEIWFGPRTDLAHNGTAVRLLLKQSGFDVEKMKFYRSTIPLNPRY